MNKIKFTYLLVCLFAASGSFFAQDNRSQIPPLMQKSFFEVNLGYIQYPFSADQLEPGYELTGDVEIPHPAVRLILFGYEFNKYLAAQITYMRPVSWIKYPFVNTLTAISEKHSVWMNVGGLTLKPSLPLGEKFNLYGEAGLGLITRHGITDYYNNQVVSDAMYGYYLFGGGVQYKISNHWKLQICSNYSPANSKQKQPATFFAGFGFNYRYDQYSQDKLEHAKALGYIHPKQWVKFGYTSNVAGYGINNFLERACLFWGGHVEIKNGYTLAYHRNIFHGAKVFSLDIGADAGYWTTKGSAKNPGMEENFWSVSIYPVFRLNFLRTKPLDAYFFYSVAGPSYLSKVIIDDFNTGGHFTFHDTMGTGLFFGKKRNFNAELKISHFSNGNTFPHNDSVKIPMSLDFGVVF
ncbi:MAG: acyloxyacyl hydrolase [Crocinitomicaceae bacterium]|nr:acyloxyacyl hydrolase [Crocinitomicaceae bacterium]